MENKYKYIVRLAAKWEKQGVFQNSNVVWKEEQRALSLFCYFYGDLYGTQCVSFLTNKSV